MTFVTVCEPRIGTAVGYAIVVATPVKLPGWAAAAWTGCALIVLAKVAEIFYPAFSYAYMTVILVGICGYFIGVLVVIKHCKTRRIVGEIFVKLLTVFLAQELLGLFLPVYKGVPGLMYGMSVNGRVRWTKHLHSLVDIRVDPPTPRKVRRISSLAVVQGVSREMAVR